MPGFPRFLAPLAVAAALAVAGAPARAVMVSPLYLTSGDTHTNYIVNNTVAVPFAAHNSEEYPIAVSGGTVRTVGITSGSPGAQYTPAGTYTGVNYTNPFPSGDYYDGTSDGSHNYSVDYVSGNVYRTNADWTSPALLFSIAGGFGRLGITYDATNNSLWVSNYGGVDVTDYTLGGTQLSTFNATAAGGSLSFLALDPLDNTLWLGSQSFETTLYHYTKGGSLIETTTVAGLAGANVLGGEFGAAAISIPEPSPLTLAGVLGALAGAGAWWRRKRAAA